MLRPLCALAALTLAAPAQAEWLEASSRHFVVYANTSVADITEEALRLETLDFFLRTYHGVEDPPQLDANRLTVYVTPDLKTLQALYGPGGREIGGFYVPRVEGAVAFTPLRGLGGSQREPYARVVLFHEYAHHFLFANYSIAYPAWFAEGYAEFVSTMGDVGPNIIIGRGSAARAYSMVYNYGGLSTRELFAPPRELTGAETDSIYSRGFLLTHYLMTNAERRKQLDSYLTALNRGTPSEQAATAAFGDLDALDKQLNSYVRLRRWNGAAIARSSLPAFAVKVRQLSAGEAAMMSFRMASDRGVNEKSGPDLYARAAPVAARFAQDSIAQGWFAEIAYDAGKLDAADAAADLAVKADARNIQGLVYKARIALARAAAAKKPAGDPAWTRARSWILRANGVSNDDADALSLFYFSFGIAEETPTKNARNALQRAFELVPQDPGLRFAVVRQALIDGDVARARKVLLPLAYSPHASPDSTVTKLLAAIDAKQPSPALLAVIDKPDEPAAP